MNSHDYKVQIGGLQAANDLSQTLVDKLNRDIEHLTAERDSAMRMLGALEQSWSGTQLRLRQANALIHELETNCDPAGTVRSVVELREQVAALSGSIVICDSENMLLRVELAKYKADALDAHTKVMNFEYMLGLEADRTWPRIFKDIWALSKRSCSRAWHRLRLVVARPKYVAEVQSLESQPNQKSP